MSVDTITQASRLDKDDVYFFDLVTFKVSRLGSCHVWFSNI